jgi:hypothetical protein
VMYCMEDEEARTVDGGGKEMVMWRDGDSGGGKLEFHIGSRSAQNDRRGQDTRRSNENRQAKVPSEKLWIDRCSERE